MTPQFNLLCLFFLVTMVTILSIGTGFIHSSVHTVRRRQILKSTQENTKEPTSNDPGFLEFMRGPEKKQWKGERGILKRRNQVPDTSYTVKDVVGICMRALQNNDDPQLDHGACVVLEFRSPAGPLNDHGLNPASFGYFLRSTEGYDSLLDYASFKFEGEPLQLQDSLSMKQRVRVTGWKTGEKEKSGDRLYDFYLSNVEETWLVDVILKVDKN